MEHKRLPIWAGVLVILLLLVGGGAALFFQPLFGSEVVWVTARTDLPETDGVRVVRSLDELGSRAPLGLGIDAGMVAEMSAAERERVRAYTRRGTVLFLVGEPVPDGLLEELLGTERLPPGAGVEPGWMRYGAHAVHLEGGEYWIGYASGPADAVQLERDALALLHRAPDLLRRERLDRLEAWLRSLWPYAR